MGALLGSSCGLGVDACSAECVVETNAAHGKSDGARSRPAQCTFIKRGLPRHGHDDQECPTTTTTTTIIPDHHCSPGSTATAAPTTTALWVILLLRRCHRSHCWFRDDMIGIVVDDPNPDDYMITYRNESWLLCCYSTPHFNFRRTSSTDHGAYKNSNVRWSDISWPNRQQIFVSTMMKRIRIMPAWCSKAYWRNQNGITDCAHPAGTTPTCSLKDLWKQDWHRKDKRTRFSWRRPARSHRASRVTDSKSTETGQTFWGVGYPAVYSPGGRRLSIQTHVTIWARAQREILRPTIYPWVSIIPENRQHTVYIATRRARCYRTLLFSNPFAAHYQWLFCFSSYFEAFWSQGV
jgi:hypothetical protein